MPSPKPSLWDFARAVYGQAEVAEICLTWQEKLGTDTCLLLFCIWYAKHHGQLSDPALREIQTLVADWNDQAVVRLRQLRQWLKQPNPRAAPFPAQSWSSLRTRVKELELEAERMELDALQNWCGQLTTMNRDSEEAIADARANLRKYLQLHGEELNRQLASSLERLAVLAVTGADARD